MRFTQCQVSWSASLYPLSSLFYLIYSGYLVDDQVKLEVRLRLEKAVLETALEQAGGQIHAIGE